MMVNVQMVISVVAELAQQNEVSVLAVNLIIRWQGPLPTTNEAYLEH